MNPEEMHFLTSAIGSLPHKNVDEACKLVLQTIDAPAWPQLPGISFYENMYAQFTEGFPGIVIDENKRRVFFETGKLSDELEDFYRAILADEIQKFEISGKYARGLEMFLEEFASELETRMFLKGQVTGPVTFGMTVTDENGKASFYNETLEEVVTKGLTFKARWQTQKFKDIAPQAKVIMFFDEPYLVSLGSGLLALNPERIYMDLEEVFNGCQADLTGIHVCGKTDWSLVLKTGIDIVNFDAWNYLEAFLAYSEEIKSFLNRGGIIAWGVVPNDDEILSVSLEELARIIEESFDRLEPKGIDRRALAGQSMITPRCGITQTTVGNAKKVLEVTSKLGEIMRERYF